MQRLGPREFGTTASISAIQFPGKSGYWRVSSGGRDKRPLPQSKFVTFTKWWHTYVMHFLRPETEELPPPLSPMLIEPDRDRQQFLAEAKDNIRHRERILRMLEERAEARTGQFKEQT